MSLSPPGGDPWDVFIKSQSLVETRSSITHNLKSSSWKRAGWTSRSWGRLGSRPEDKDTPSSAPSQRTEGRTRFRHGDRLKKEAAQKARNPAWMETIETKQLQKCLTQKYTAEKRRQGLFYFSSGKRVSVCCVTPQECKQSFR